MESPYSKSSLGENCSGKTRSGLNAALRSHRRETRPEPVLIPKPNPLVGLVSGACSQTPDVHQYSGAPDLVHEINPADTTSQ